MTFKTTKKFDLSRINAAYVYQGILDNYLKKYWKKLKAKENIQKKYSRRIRNIKQNEYFRFISRWFEIDEAMIYVGMPFKKDFFKSKLLELENSAVIRLDANQEKFQLIPGEVWVWDPVVKKMKKTKGILSPKYVQSIMTGSELRKLLIPEKVSSEDLNTISLNDLDEDEDE